MSYYNWKTGRWATYKQCSQTSTAAEQELTLEKYSPEKIEKTPPRNRAKQIFDGYRRFENRIYGRMLGKGHHQLVAALAKYLLRATTFCISIYVFCKLAIFLIASAFQLFFMVVAFLFYEREMTVLDNIFWCVILFFVGFFCLFFVSGLRAPDVSPSQNKNIQSEQRNNPLKIDLKVKKDFWGNTKIVGVAKE